LLNLSIKDLGFHQFKTDACIYKLSNFDNIHTLYLGVFLDDILCLGASSSIITWFQNEMEHKFIITITIKFNVESFLGMQCNRECQAISLSQPGYIANLMYRFNINISN